MKILKKLIIFTFIISFITIISCFIYIKTSPKPVINSANNLILYDQDNIEYFKETNQKNGYL